MLNIQDISIDKIKVGEHEQRIEVDDDEISELAGSIRRVGLINPLSVTETGDGYLLIAGHRRLEACKRIGFEIVPCIVAIGDEATKREITFAENFFSRNLTAVRTNVDRAACCRLSEVSRLGPPADSNLWLAGRCPRGPTNGQAKRSRGGKSRMYNRGILQAKPGETGGR